MVNVIFAEEICPWSLTDWRFFWKHPHSLLSELFLFSEALFSSFHSPGPDDLKQKIMLSRMGTESVEFDCTSLPVLGCNMMCSLLVAAQYWTKYRQ